MASIADQVTGALRAIEKLLSGEEPPIDLAESLAAVERFLGLNRPLVSYSRRSRQRFVAAARQGLTPEQAYRAERQKRASNVLAKWGLTEAQFRVIHRLMMDIQATGVDVEYYHDAPVIKSFATLYGYQYLKRVFTQQLDSIKQYVAGNRQPGRTRWDDRGSIEAEYGQKFGASVYLINDTDPFYYYHGTQ